MDQWRSSGSGTTRIRGRISLSPPGMLRNTLRRSEGVLRLSTRFSVGTHRRESHLDLLQRLRWVFFLALAQHDVRTYHIPHQPSTTRTGPPSPFFQGEISPMFKQRITETLGSSSPTTPTPPTRIRRGKPRNQIVYRESSAGPSSTPTPPSSPTSRNTRAAGEENVSVYFWSWSWRHS